MFVQSMLDETLAVIGFARVPARIQMKFKYPALIEMRRRTNQMIAFNQPWVVWWQNLCKCKLQIIHR